MTRSFTQVAADSVGDKIATDQVADGDDVVDRQIVRLAGDSPEQLQAVTNATPAADAYAAAVRVVGGVDVDVSALATQATAVLELAKLTAIADNTDGLEGFVDGIEGLITSLNALVDGLEGSIGTTADAASVAGDVGSMNAKLRLTTSLLNDVAVAIAFLQGLVGLTTAAAAAVGGDGSQSAKLKLMTSQLDAITTGVSLTITRLTEIRDGTATAAAAAAVTSVSGLASNVTLLAANASRRTASIFNDSSAFLYVKLGATASLTSFTVRLNPYGLYELLDRYVGVIDGIWASATGSARLTETT